MHKKSLPIREFMDQVDRLIDRVLLKESWSRGEESRDVRRVAFGLVALRRLVEREIAATPLYDLSAKGLIEAAEILEALTTGFQHPVHDYLAEAKGTKR